MAKRTIKAGNTSNREYVVIRDGNGSPITGLVYNSTGLIAYYVLPGAASVAITLATQTVTGAYSSGGFVEVDATHAPGLYRFDAPDASFAASNHKSIICLSGYSGMAALYLEYDLFAIDPQDSVRFGLTALPNATAGAVGGVPLGVDSSGRVDVLKINGTSQTARDIGASVLLSTGTGTGQLDFTSGVVKANLAQILATALTETAGLLAGGFKKFFNVPSPALTCLGIDQTGDSYARIGTAGVGLTNLGDTRIANLDVAISTRGTSTYAGTDTSGTTTLLTRIPGTVQAQTGDAYAHLDADVSSRTKPADTQAAVTTVTSLTNAPTGGDFTATMKASLNAATPVVTVSDKTGFSLSGAGIQAIWDALTSALTTVGSIGKLLVTNIDAAISSRSTYAGGDTGGTTTLLARLTSTRAGNLDGLDVAVSTRLATSGYTAPDNTDIVAIRAKTDNLPAAPAAVSDIPTANANADALLDRTDGIESSWTFRQATRIMLAALAGKLSGAATTTIPIRDVGDTKDRITATVDSNGNRSAVSYNKT
jgi:hypothetical protein